MNGNLIFDLDDTLVKTQELYDRSKIQFVHLMKINFKKTSITIDYFDFIDSKNVAKLGFTPKRFLTTMISIYKEICVENTVKIDQGILNKIESISLIPYVDIPEKMDNVIEVLKELSARNYSMYIYSGGLREHQIKKLEFNDIDKFFEAKHFVVNKSEIELNNFLHRYQLRKETCWMIGNSIKSDINPALKLNLKCIFVKSTNWKHDEAVLLDMDIHTIQNLTESLDILK